MSGLMRTIKVEIHEVVKKLISEHLKDAKKPRDEEDENPRYKALMAARRALKNAAEEIEVQVSKEFPDADVYDIEDNLG